jgi:hypothetical protein
MSLSVVQALTKAVANNNVTTLQSTAFGSSPANGNTIIVFIASTTVPTSVTDTAGNTYTKDKESNGTTRKCSIWRATNINGGASFKITVNLPLGELTFGAVEVAGFMSAAVDQSNSDGATLDNHPDTGSVTTTQAAELLAIVAVTTAASTTWTEPAGFVSRVQESGATTVNMDGATKIDSATETINPTWTTNTSGNWNGCIVTYKEAPTATPVLPQSIVARQVEYITDDWP